MTTKNVAQHRMGTGGATRSRTGLIGFAIQPARHAKYTARRRINDLGASCIAGCPAFSHIAADFYQRPAIRGFDYLHPLGLSTRQNSVFPCESAADRTTVGRGIGHAFTLLLHVFCEVAA